MGCAGETMGAVNINTAPCDPPSRGWASTADRAQQGDRCLAWGTVQTGAGHGPRTGEGTLTALLAVFHTVAIQASSSLALRGPPLEGDSGVRDILYSQVGGLTGGAWAEGRSERGPSQWGAPPEVGFQALEEIFQLHSKPCL